MTYDQARSIIFQATSRYFTGATVVIGNSEQVKKERPMVVMTFGPLKLSTFPNEKVYDGDVADFYTGSMSLDVQLYTNGKKLSNGAMANTAVSDLTNYVNYMMSQMMTTEFSRDDLSLLTAGQIQDVTAIINDMNYEYRAMVEFNATFPVAAVGYGGVLDESSIKEDEPDPEKPGEVLPPHIDPEWSETPSGGRNEDVAEKEIGYFTDVKIEEMKE